jgi:hypothetical protein
MLSRRFRRGVAGVGIATVVMVGSASPAFAHFCRRTDFNPNAAAHAGGSNAWLTADEWREFLPFVAEDCPEAVPVIEDILDNAGPGTLFMGPGLLAGGTLKNGKGNTPDHFEYMLDAFLLCEEGEEAH